MDPSSPFAPPPEPPPEPPPSDARSVFVATSGNPAAGAFFRATFTMQNRCLMAVSLETEACAHAQAVARILEGRLLRHGPQATLAEQGADIAELLGGMPRGRRRLVPLALQAIEEVGRQAGVLP